MDPSYRRDPRPLAEGQPGVASCRSPRLGWSASASDRVARSTCARRALPTFPGCLWRARAQVGATRSGADWSHMSGRHQEVMFRPTTERGDPGRGARTPGSGTGPPVASTAWANPQMTTTIQRRRGWPAALVVAALLGALMLSFQAAPSGAAIQRDRLSPLAPPNTNRTITWRVCPIDWREGAWHVKRLIRCAASHYGLSPRKAIYIAWRESRFRPTAYNSFGKAGGIYQHLLQYWPGRPSDPGRGGSRPATRAPACAGSSCPRSPRSASGPG